MFKRMKDKKVIFWGGVEDYYKIKFNRLIFLTSPDFYVCENEESLFGKSTIKEKELIAQSDVFIVVCSFDENEVNRIESIIRQEIGCDYCKFEQLKEAEEKIRTMPRLVCDGSSELFKDRRKAYWELVNSFFASDKALRILEIGVFKASLIQGVNNYLNNPVEEYIGVDPYMGTKEDAYLGSYYADHDDASKHYIHAKEIFDRYSYAKLYREKSIDFLERAKGNDKRFDVIIVDGDHRYDACISDLKASKEILKPNGIIIVDDYANIDIKDVTPALNHFLKSETANLGEINYTILQFQNSGKYVPISLTVVGIRFD